MSNIVKMLPHALGSIQVKDIQTDITLNFDRTFNL